MGAGRLQSLFRRDEIKIDRRPVEQKRMLLAGEVLQVYGLKPEECNPPPVGARHAVPPQGVGHPPPIIFEDSDLLVVDKPAGMAAHPGTGIPPGASLIERVLTYLAPLGGQGGSVFSPALAHRLDKETSGVILIAKTGPRLRSLTAALREGKIHKRYLALVAGHPPESGVIDAPLIREDSAAGAKSRVGAKGGKSARTRYHTLKKLGSHALLQVIIDTGRMHQIRAHLAHLGFPVAGDTRYGRPSEVRGRMKAIGLRRLFLHAEEISWDEGGRARSFRASLPPELRAVLDRLETPASFSAP